MKKENLKKLAQKTLLVGALTITAGDLTPGSWEARADHHEEEAESTESTSTEDTAKGAEHSCGEGSCSGDKKGSDHQCGEGSCSKKKENK